MPLTGAEGHSKNAFSLFKVDHYHTLKIVIYKYLFVWPVGLQTELIEPSEEH